MNKLKQKGKIMRMNNRHQISNKKTVEQKMKEIRINP